MLGQIQVIPDDETCKSLQELKDQGFTFPPYLLLYHPDNL